MGHRITRSLIFKNQKLQGAKGPHSYKERQKREQGASLGRAKKHRQGARAGLLMPKEELRASGRVAHWGWGGKIPLNVAWPVERLASNPRRYMG